MDSLEFLERGAKQKPQPIYVTHGDEDFLKRQALRLIQAIVLPGPDNDFGLTVHAGDAATFPQVREDLDMLPFLSPRRLVVVENADPFVTKYRAALEKYVDQPAKTGVLVLDVKTWPSTTRLAKMIDNAGTIVCKTPPVSQLPQWCRRWATAQHGKQLDPNAAQLLVDQVGPIMGQLDQELAKLASYVGNSNRIDMNDVDQLVSRSRTADTFRIFDAIGAGQTGAALAILDRLLDQGNEPIAILGAFSWQLRRLAQAARLATQGRSLTDALEEAGIPPFARRGCEQQLHHLGRHKAERLYDWLLEVDLGLKGGSPLDARVQLERLVVRLAQG
ncbi:MAG: DNA polymerase III subunit delta [Gemmataceae bacterium]